jgi:hypothetical protein
MPENLVIGLFVFGAVLILIALVGGKFKIFSVAVSSNISSPFIRIIAFVLGMTAMLLALVPNMISNALTNPTTQLTPLATETLKPDPQPTSTYILPTIVADTPVPLKPNPTEFIVSYWQNVSDGRFEISWAQLSPGFQHVMHHDDYFDYVRGLQEMQICRILVSNPSLVEQGVFSAVVTAHLVFYIGSQCNSSEYNFETRLIYIEVSNSWLLDKNMIKP